MTLLSQGSTSVAEEYMKLMEHLRKAQEAAAMISHLHGDTDDKSRLLAKGWLIISEGLRMMIHKVTQLAQGRLH